MSVISYDNNKVNIIRNDLNVTLNKMQVLKTQLNNTIRNTSYDGTINNVSNSVNVCYNNIVNIINMLDDSQRIYREIEDNIKISIMDIKSINVNKRRTIVK